MIKGAYTTREAVSLAGFRTAMMVDYLCRQGLVVPSRRPEPGRGRARLYGFGDLIVLRAVNRLLASGLPVVRLRPALKSLQRRLRSAGPETALPRYLVTDGRSLRLADEPDLVLALNQAGPLPFALIVDIERARRCVAAALEPAPHRPRPTGRGATGVATSAATAPPTE